MATEPNITAVKTDQDRTKEPKNSYFITRLLLLCLGASFLIISVVSLVPAINSPTAIPTAGAAKVQFIHIIQHPIAEILSPVGWVSFGIHLSVAAHVDLKLTYMDKAHFIAVWFHHFCCIYHCVSIGSIHNVFLLMIPAAVLAPIYFYTTAIRVAIRENFFQWAKEEFNLEIRNGSDKRKIEKLEGQIVVDNLMRGFTIVGGMAFLLSEVTECLQGIYTKNEADVKCNNIYMNNFFILTIMSQVFVYKILLVDTGSCSITNVVRCNAKKKMLRRSTIMAALCVIQIFVLFAVRHLPRSDLGIAFSVVFGYMPMMTMPICLAIVVREVRRRYQKDLVNVTMEVNAGATNGCNDMEENYFGKDLNTSIGELVQPKISDSNKYVVRNGTNQET